MEQLPKTDPERQIRPCGDFLQDMNGGVSHTDLSQALNDLVTAVATYGKVGQLTYTVKIRPAGRSASTVFVSDEIKLKTPEGERPESVFFVSSDGNVTRHQPNQMRMPLREVPGGIVV